MQDIKKHLESLGLGEDGIAEIFDGYWSVQTHQHIPDLRLALNEANRVLKNGGAFATYNLNIQPWHKFLCGLLRKPYIIEGLMNGQFFLRRATDNQVSLIDNLFKTKSSSRYSELFFQPPLKLLFPGKLNSLLGKVDAFLSGESIVHKFIARQRSFHTFKTNTLEHGG